MAAYSIYERTSAPWNYRQTEFEEIPFGILAHTRKNLRCGENCFDAARRVLVHEALAATNGHQKQAAKVLNVSPRAMNYLYYQLQIRPVDRRSDA